MVLSAPPNWPQPGTGGPGQTQPGQNWPPAGQPQQPQQGQNPPPRRGWAPPGQGWPPPSQPQNRPPYAPQHQPQYGPRNHQSQYVPRPQQYRPRDVRPPVPGVLTAARIVVMIPSGIWLFSLLMIWLFQGSFSGSTLGPLVSTFILGLAAGDWAPMVLLPLAGCALTLTMGAGHQIDRWIFTAAAVLWTVWFWWNVHFPLTPTWLAVALVITALVCVWVPAYSHWLKAVEEWEMRQAAPPSDGRNSAAQRADRARPEGPAR